MAATINSTVTGGITFGTGTYTSPLTITATGAVIDPNGAAITAPYTYANPVLVNYGTIVSTLPPAGFPTAVYFMNGGIVANAGTDALIFGVIGINIQSTAGTVTNAGTIVGYLSDAVNLAGGGSVGNTGLIKGATTGIAFLSGGGTLTNSGTVTGGYGVVVYDGVGMVTNSGTVLVTADGAGIQLKAGGTVHVTGGLIQAYTAGIDIDGIASVTIDGGTIISTGADTTAHGIYLRQGGEVTVTAGLIQGRYGVFIKDAGTLTNGGTIAGRQLGLGAGVELGSGSIGNTGRIQGYDGAVISGAGTVTNGGTIIGSQLTLGAGIKLGSGSIDNTGLIQGYSAAEVSGAGTVTNSGTIAGYQLAPGAGIKLGSGNIDNIGLVTGGYGVTGGSNSAVTNAGTIVGYQNAGVYLLSGVVNNTAGLIETTVINQFKAAISFGLFGGNDTVTNGGTIAGPQGGAGWGIYLGLGSDVVNNTGLIVTGRDAVVSSGNATITNSGTILGTDQDNGYGIALFQTGGTITNTGTIFGAVTGIYSATSNPATIINTGTIGGLERPSINLTTGGTVVNSGTIGAGNGTAINLGGSGGNLLVLEYGYSLGGAVALHGSDNTLQMLGTLGAVAVDFNKSGAGLTGFDTVAFGATSGYDQTLKITDTAVLPGTIAGFTQLHDIVDLTGIDPIGTQATLNASNQLVVTRNGSDVASFQLDNEDYAGILWQTTPDGSGGTDVEKVACFHRGTRIRTVDGDVAIEDLRSGDHVVTHDRRTRVVRWIGHRHLDLTRHPDRDSVSPIVVRADALGEGMPVRDLCVSPDHAMLLDGGLVLARALVNGSSITRDLTRRSLDWYHVELDTHDILLAEGAPAESYLDTGNRGMFGNADGPVTLHPLMQTGQAARTARSCAPLWDDPAVVQPIWRRLAQRAEQLGFASPGALRVTDDPGLTLEAEGRTYRPAHCRNGVYTFVVPALLGEVRLASRSTAPSRLQPWLGDERRLGIAVRRVTLRQGKDVQIIPADHPGLTEGWWTVESDGSSIWRWTDGAARLAVQSRTPAVVEIETCIPKSYVIGEKSTLNAA
jgi:collagen type I/II/III/V/XI/XXIV/XXVII alpha